MPPTKISRSLRADVRLREAGAWAMISNFFFGSGENLFAAFLPEISRTRAFGQTPVPVVNFAAAVGS